MVRGMIWGALCFFATTSVFVVLYWCRLYASAFPPLDIQEDLKRFPSHVLPVASIVGTVVFLGVVLCKTHSIADSARWILVLAVPVLLSVMLFDYASSSIGVSNVSRGLFGCSCAFAFFLVINYAPKVLHKRKQ